MVRRLSVPLFVAVLLSACVSTAGVLPTTGVSSTTGVRYDPTENLRTIALDEVREYGKETRLFFEKNGKEKTIATAQKSLSQTLKDPDSAKFQNVRIVDYEGGKVVCGEVNGKNSYGGYVGYKPFAAGISGSTLYDTRSKYPDLNAAVNAGIIAACGSR